ncbi:type II secretion system protein N [Psychrobacter aestuarii]|uniref:Type II secretion system protein N n=1 Tax=Psychrobacter aestuarii TaxID=556327 RepID=A0ABN0VLK2_9GAMM|nr:type II secretion system protein N [Psychrobacter aestuarii]
MAKSSDVAQKRPRKLWWLVGCMVFMLMVIVQMPASWLLDKYAADNRYVQYVSGNLWQGSLVWQLPSGNTALTGAGTWTWQPWQLLLGTVGADVELQSGQTRLSGEARIHRQGWQVENMDGKIAPETLRQWVSWQLPDAPIQANNVRLSYQKADEGRAAGFDEADGQLTWVGGMLGYPKGGQYMYLTLPPMHAQLSAVQKDAQSRLHMQLLDNQDKRLGDIYLDGTQMLDISLTQRLLEQMPSYQGKAPQDTNVVNVRQPITQLGAR